MLRRIAAVDKVLNAYITVCGEQARQVAQAAEKMISAGYHLGPLHGIPIAIKDNIYTRGVRTTAGSKIPGRLHSRRRRHRHGPPQARGGRDHRQDQPARVRLGWHHGQPSLRHLPQSLEPGALPRRVERGSGAAVAARTCLGALGTDTGGSIRLPSSVNGIVGIRPTIGRVSNHSVVPLAWTMDTVSPMTRTVEDCVLMFEIIAGHDPLDDHSAQVPLSDYRSELTRGVQGLRVGLIRDYSLAHVQPAVGDTIRAALTTLESLGMQVEEIAMPSIHGNISAQLTIESCEPSTYHQEWLRTRAADYGDDVRTLLELGEMYLATHYLQAQRYRSVLRKEFLEGFKHVDVFVTPTLPFTATPCSATEVVIENGQREDMLSSAIMQFTGVPSLAGLPALSIPVGFDAEGLPVGMQVIGRPFDEGTLFRLGHAYQGATSWHTRAPRL